MGPPDNAAADHPTPEPLGAAVRRTPGRHRRDVGGLFGRYVLALRAGVGGETKSYGFTLVVWGTGGFAIATRGGPSQLEVVGFVGGVLGAMLLAILVTFGGPGAPARRVELNRYAAGAVHLGSVVGALAGARAVIALVAAPVASYGLAAFVGIVLYQLLLGVELAASLRPPGGPPSSWLEP